MASSVTRVGPRYAALGKAVYHLTRPLSVALGRICGLYGQQSAVAREHVEAARRALSRGESVYVLGIGASGHNAGVGLTEDSAAGGIRLIANNEEERFRGIKHYKRFPHLSVEAVKRRLGALGIAPRDLSAIVTTFDFPDIVPTMRRNISEEGPRAFAMFGRAASMIFDSHDIAGGFRVPDRVGHALGLEVRRPVLALRHHDNHAWLSYGVSPSPRGADRQRRYLLRRCPLPAPPPRRASIATCP